MAAKSSKSTGNLRITQVRSLIGTNPGQRRTVRALGLRRIRDSVTQPDRPEIRGMITKVSHLVEVEETAASGGTSDSEVILHLYAEMGTDCISKLRGMFAFAIWDQTEKRLFAARDWLGQRPFYYSCNGETFSFASEIKGLLAINRIAAEIDLEALDRILNSFILVN